MLKKEIMKAVEKHFSIAENEATSMSFNKLINILEEVEAGEITITINCPPSTIHHILEQAIGKADKLSDLYKLFNILANKPYYEERYNIFRNRIVCRMCDFMEWDDAYRGFLETNRKEFLYLMIELMESPDQAKCALIAAKAMSDPALIKWAEMCKQVVAHPKKAPLLAHCR